MVAKGITMQEINDFAVHDPRVGWLTITVTAVLAAGNWVLDSSTNVAQWVPTNVVWLGGCASIALSVTMIYTKLKANRREEARSKRQAKKTRLEIEILERKLKSNPQGD